MAAHHMVHLVDQGCSYLGTPVVHKCHTQLLLIVTILLFLGNIPFEKHKTVLQCLGVTVCLVGEVVKPCFL